MGGPSRRGLLSHSGISFGVSYRATLSSVRGSGLCPGVFPQDSEDTPHLEAHGQAHGQQVKGPQAEAAGPPPAQASTPHPGQVSGTIVSLACGGHQDHWFEALCRRRLAWSSGRCPPRPGP